MKPSNPYRDNRITIAEWLQHRAWEEGYTACMQGEDGYSSGYADGRSDEMDNNDRSVEAL